MQKNEAEGYYRHGMHLLHADRLEEALIFFTRAIGRNARYAEAFRSRGEVLYMLGRVAEADADLLQAKSLQEGAGAETSTKATRKVAKYDLTSVHNLYDDLLAVDDPVGDDTIDFGGGHYDYVFSDDALESDTLLASLTAGQGRQSDFPAILEYLDGRRQEAPISRLFGPGPDEIALTRNDGGAEQIISLEQLSCIRLARVPADFARNQAAGCQVEVIETIDGNIYHESIHPEQVLKNVLYGFSTKKDSRFKYTLIPRSSIRKRFQRRHLGQILLDRNLIAWEVLEQALAEHGELKKVKFGKIIAQEAKILYSAVEFEIQRAYQDNRQGLKIGEILLNAGLVNEEQIKSALEQQERLKTKKLGQFLIEKGILQEREVYMALAEKFRVPFVDLRQQKVTRTILGHLPRELIRKLHVLPLAVREDVLVVATFQPDPGPFCEVVHRYASARNVEFVLVQPSHLKNVIRVLFREQRQDTPVGTTL
ncbi:MAG: GspE/PulE/PilB domain-containing protein [Desulfobulbaceae bacterium]